jgi:4a-hydroxytetrahydrobiopterin dehydratase
MARLSDEEIAAALAADDLPGWERDDDRITKEFRFRNFVDAVAFIDRLVAPAEAANHHPDLENHYNRVRVSLRTWDEGGVTEKDLALARAIEALSPPDAAAP